MPNRFTQGCMPWDHSPNPLLTKDALGSTKPVVNPLPPDGHTYGDRVLPDEHNCQDVLYSTQQHVPSRPRPPKKDMLALNKACVANLLSTAPEFYQFRGGKQPHHRLDRGSTHIPIVLPEQSFVYGKRTPPENTKLLLSNAFMQAQEEANIRKYCEEYTASALANPRLSFYKTKSHQLAYRTNRTRIASFREMGQEDWDPWKLTRFTARAQSKIKDEVEAHRTRYLSERRRDDKQPRGCAFP
jgi:hypothetical protein